MLYNFSSVPYLYSPHSDSNVSPRLRKSTTVKESKSKRRSGGTDSSKSHSPHSADPSKPVMAEEFPPEDVNVLMCAHVWHRYACLEAEERLVQVMCTSGM